MRSPALVNSGDPEVPTHIATRKATALTQLAAEELHSEEVLSETGRQRINPGLAAYNAKRKKAPIAALAAKAPAEPLKGMTAAQINEVRGREYPDAPAKDSTLGDLTPSFYKYMWLKQPKDAAIRYYGRVLPAELTSL